MRLGMVGMGRMGSAMARRLMRAGHEVVAQDVSASALRAVAAEGARIASTAEELVLGLAPPRVAWMMLPAAVVERAIDELAPLLQAGDVIVDGGNSFYQDDILRARALESRGLRYVDVGVSGGVWGGERGYCQMIGGPVDAVEMLDPIFRALAPGVEAAPRTPGREGRPSTAELGYLHCGPSGAGHFVKMIHNGIEYGLMAAYGEGLSILRHADAGGRAREVDAETAPLRDPDFYRYELPLADIAELWRRGSVIGSWLLDLTAQALRDSPDLSRYAGRVADSGEGRWALEAAIDEGVPAPVLAAALFQRFASRGGHELADKLLSALRYAFGGHREGDP